MPALSTYRLHGAAADEEEPRLAGATPMSSSYNLLLVTRSFYSHLFSYCYKYFTIILFTLLLFCMSLSPSLSNHSFPPNPPSPPWLIVVFCFPHFILILSGIDCVQILYSNLQCSRRFVLPLVNAMPPKQHG